MTWRACKRATPSVEYGWIHPLYPGAVNELPEKLRAPILSKIAVI